MREQIARALAGVLVRREVHEIDVRMPERDRKNRLLFFSRMTLDDRIATLRAFVAHLPEPRRPPIVVPGEGFATAEMIFRHIDPAAMPEIVDVLEWLMQHQPGVLAGTADEDRTLVWDALERTPLENLTVVCQMTRGPGGDRSA